MTQWLSVLVSAVLMTACSSPSSGSGDTSITVFAASSLSDVFRLEARAYGHPVTFSFGGSQALAAQVRSGAPADLLATADSVSVKAAGEPARVFARNLLQIAVRPGNPKRVRGLSDLGRRDLVVVLAASSVPAGKYAAAALTKAGVTVHPASLEDSVRGALTKVELGEADAALVYVTDVRSAGSKVVGVDLPTAHNVPASYYVANVHGATNTAGARGFANFVLSDKGQAVLRAAGFLPP